MLAVSPEQKKDFAQGKIVPWLWGQIQFRDFMGGVGETGFIAFRYPELRAGDKLLQEAAFRFNGPPAYTYQRYSENGLS